MGATDSLSSRIYKLILSYLTVLHEQVSIKSLTHLQQDESFELFLRVSVEEGVDDVDQVEQGSRQVEQSVSALDVAEVLLVARRRCQHTHFIFIFPPGYHGEGLC